MYQSFGSCLFTCVTCCVQFYLDGIEPTSMVLGQAAVTTATLCIDNQLDVKKFFPYELFKKIIVGRWSDY